MPGTFEIKKAKDGQIHFNLKAANGEIVLSSEMYKAKSGAKNGIESERRNAREEARFAKLESKTGEPYFVLRAGNHQVIGKGEMYETTRARDNGIRSVAKNAPAAKVVDLTSG